MNEKRETLKNIFMAGVNRANPYKILKNNVNLKNSTLTIDTPTNQYNFDLSKYKKIFIIGAGKATATMAKAIEEIFKNKIDKGFISVKYGHTENLNKIKIIEAGHPVPDDNSFKAAKKILNIAEKADEETLVITLISGGGSALMTHPIKNDMVEISLDDIQNTTEKLLECGAIINEINCLRKHLSEIKGGKLANALFPATSINLILSDVVGDRLDTIASGPTSPDEKTFQGMKSIIKKYEIENQLPKNVLKLLDLGLKNKIMETPGKDNKIFKNTTNILIGTNYLSLLDSKKESEKNSFNTIILSSQIIGEAKEVAKVFAGIAKDVKKNNLLGDKPLCIIAGGETTVTLKGNGKGGRNQEIALSFLSEIEKEPDAFEDIYFLSASTDGNDGPTDAAGAYADLDLLHNSKNKKLDITEYLKNNDSYNFFDSIDGLLKTGPTNTNVCDIHIILIK